MRISLLAIFLLITNVVVAQTTVELTVEELTDPKVTVATIDTGYLNIWKDRVVKTTNHYLRLLRTGNDVRILVTFPKGKPTEIEVSARPQINEFKVKGLINRLSALSRPPRSRLTDYAFLITGKVNGGSRNAQLKFLPEIYLPDEKVRIKYEAADFAGKINLMQTWVQEEVIPVLAFYQSEDMTKLEGVRAMGKLLETDAFLRKSTRELTVKNPDYWQATAEVPKGDGMIVLSKICMHIVNGEFDLAKRYLYLAQAFPEQNSMATYYYKQLNFRMEWLFDDLRSKILKGKAWQQEGDYHGAQLHFEEILRTMPKSAEATFERYYSRSLLISHRPPEEIIDLWKECKEKVFARDPLYAMNIPAKSSQELYELNLRHELRQMLEDKANISKNLVKFADYALDLKAYGLAAQMYWMILMHIPEDEAVKGRDVEAYYLYCLNKLGGADNLSHYETDVVKGKFRKIEKQRKEAMKANPIFTKGKGDNKKNRKKKNKK